MYAAVPAAFDSRLARPVVSDVSKSHSNCNDNPRRTPSGAKWGVDVVVTACDVHELKDFAYLFTL